MRCDSSVLMNQPNSHDEYWMRRCLELAARAASEGEVPVGAVIVGTHAMAPSGVLEPTGELGMLIAEAANLKETSKVATHHAEIRAIEKACEYLGRWRLSECTLYVSLEPCIMCAGAIVQARLARVVYGAVDPKAGAIESTFSVFAENKLNHAPSLRGGVLQAECANLLKEFFKARRA